MPNKFHKDLRRDIFVRMGKLYLFAHSYMIIRGWIKKIQTPLV